MKLLLSTVVLAGAAAAQSAVGVTNNGGDTSVSTGDGNDAIAVNGDGGNTDINSGGGDDVIVVGGDGTTNINDGDGDDKVWGGDGDDTFNNGDGNDKIRGGGGDDTFIDGDGNDRYGGGRGSDKYYFDLKNTKGRMQRVFNYQRNDNFQDEIHLLNMNPDEVELTNTQIEVCKTDIVYTRPNGKKHTVRVKSRNGCITKDQLVFENAVEPSTLPDYTRIPDQTCMGDFAYINDENPAYDASVHGTVENPVKTNNNPLRFLVGATRDEAAEECARVCSAHDECIAFNIVHTGLHSDGFGGTRGEDDTTATCYFRTSIRSSQVSVNNKRDCYRIVPEIELIRQESRTTCVEDSNYGFTADYSRFYVDAGCRGTFNVGDKFIHAESWGFKYADYEY